VSRETDRIQHIATVLYSWRKSHTSTAQKPSAKDYAYVAQKKALEDDVKQRGMKATIDWQIPFSMWRVQYELESKPLVSIVIPTKDQCAFIERCLESIKVKTAYDNYEVVIVDTGSTDERVWNLYEEYKNYFTKTKIVSWDKPFNFAAVCDFGAENSSGDYFLFLNNDTEVITPSWIEDMLGYAQQRGIGAVGCKLLYPDGRLQHGGIVLGVGGQYGTPGIAGHYFPAFIDNPPQDNAQQLYVGGTRNFTAVTAACVMVEKGKFNEVNGFDPEFQIAFNDVDFCLKLFKNGLRNVYLPHVQLFHYESVSVGLPGSIQRDVKVFDREIKLMLKKWQPLIENDPYYHPEFRRDVASARLSV
jgi:GT2 family glycosyltransferase